MTDELIAWQMSTTKGREFVAVLLGLTGAGALGGTGNYATDFYSLGRRSVGEDILRFIRGMETEDGLALEYKMMREQKQREEEDENGEY